MKEISVVIVNYRVKYFLEQTIRSAKEALAGRDVEIIVIDNDSQDDSIEYAKGMFPDVTFIENKENVGFAKANNQGFNVAAGKYILILNPDTIICKETVDACYTWAETHSDCGGIGVKMHDGNGVFLPESKRSFPTPWVSFCKIFGLSTLFPKSKWFAKYHLRYLDNREVHPIDILAGAFIFVNAELLRQCGGFDEAYFMYGEDIDLSYKFSKAGYQNYYLPNEIIHYKGESTKKNSMKYVKVFYEAMLIFFRKHYPHYSKIYYFFVKFAILIRAGLAALRRLLHPILSKKEQQPACYYVQSRRFEEIKAKLPNACVKPYSEYKDNAELSMIVLDSEEMSYSDIIVKIVSNKSQNIRFAIFSGNPGTLITPKFEG